MLVAQTMWFDICDVCSVKHSVWNIVWKATSCNRNDVEGGFILGNLRLANCDSLLRGEVQLGLGWMVCQEFRPEASISVSMDDSW